MALKKERVVIETDITHSCESVAERGVVLVYKTSGSGIALGDTAGEADLVSNPSGKVVFGVLLNDVVNVDETRYKMNFHKDETRVGDPCNVLRKGRVTTDKVTGTPTVGATAYLTSNGTVTPTLSSTGGLVATPKVGQFVSIKDESGFVTLDINLPIIG